MPSSSLIGSLLLSFSLIVLGSKCPAVEQPSKQIVCYYEGGTPVDQLNVCNCTQLIFTNAVDVNGFNITAGKDIYQNEKSILDLKPLQLIFSVSLKPQETIALLKSEENKISLLNSISLLLRTTDFRGVEIDFNFAGDDGSKREDLVAFLKDLRGILDHHRTKRDSYSVFEDLADDITTGRYVTEKYSQIKATTPLTKKRIIKRKKSRNPREEKSVDFYDDDDTEFAVNEDEVEDEPLLKRTKRRKQRVDEEGELKESNEMGYLILLRLSTQPEILAKKYDLKGVSKYVDYFMVPTHFITDDSEKFVTFHPSRLMGLSDMLNTDSILDLLTGLGAPKEKLIVSLPASVQQFTLKDAKQNTARSPTTGNPEAISQAKMCSLLKSGNWTIERDEDLTAPYAFSKTTWLAFEDEISINIKAKYIILRDLAGGAIYPIDADDSSESCAYKQGGRIAGVLQNNFGGLARKPRQVVLESLQEQIHDKSFFSQEAGVHLSEYRIVRVVDHTGAVHVIRKNTKTEFECSRQGYFSHPLGCNKFYRCVKFNQYTDDYTVFEYDCPAGLAFDERWEVCVWPGSLPNGAPCTGSSEIAPVPRSYYQCPNTEGYYADPENCRWFFACLDHARDGVTPLTAYEFRCPFGLVFDENTLVCDWPWKVGGCGARGLAGTVVTRVQGSSLYQGNAAAINAGADYINGLLQNQENRASFATIPDYIVSGGRIANKDGGVILNQNLIGLAGPGGVHVGQSFQPATTLYGTRLSKVAQPASVLVEDGGSSHRGEGGAALSSVTPSSFLVEDGGSRHRGEGGAAFSSVTPSSFIVEDGGSRHRGHGGAAFSSVTPSSFLVEDGGSNHRGAGGVAFSSVNPSGFLVEDGGSRHRFQSQLGSNLNTFNPSTLVVDDGGASHRSQGAQLNYPSQGILVEDGGYGYKSGGQDYLSAVTPSSIIVENNGKSHGSNGGAFYSKVSPTISPVGSVSQNEIYINNITPAPAVQTIYASPNPTAYLNQSPKPTFLQEVYNLGRYGSVAEGYTYNKPAISFDLPKKNTLIQTQSVVKSTPQIYAQNVVPIATAKPIVYKQSLQQKPIVVQTYQQPTVYRQDLIQKAPQPIIYQQQPVSVKPIFYQQEIVTPTPVVVQKVQITPKRPVIYQQEIVTPRPIVYQQEISPAVTPRPVVYQQQYPTSLVFGAKQEVLKAIATPRPEEIVQKVVTPRPVVYQQNVEISKPVIFPQQSYVTPKPVVYQQEIVQQKPAEEVVYQQQFVTPQPVTYQQETPKTVVYQQHHVTPKPVVYETPKQVLVQEHVVTPKTILYEQKLQSPQPITYEERYITPKPVFQQNYPEVRIYSTRPPSTPKSVHYQQVFNLPQPQPESPAVYQEPIVTPKPIIYQEYKTPQPILYEQKLVRPRPVIQQQQEFIPYRQEINTPKPVVYQKTATPRPVLYQQEIVTPKPVVYQQIAAVKPAVYQEQIVTPKPVLYQQEIVTPKPVVYQQKIVTPGPVLYQQEIKTPKPVVYQQEIITPKPVIYQQKIATPRPVVYQQEIVTPKPVVYQQEIVTPKPVVYQQEIVTTKPVVYQEISTPRPVQFRQRIASPRPVVYQQENPSPVFIQQRPQKLRPVTYEQTYTTARPIIVQEVSSPKPVIYQQNFAVQEPIQYQQELYKVKEKPEKNVALVYTTPKPDFLQIVKNVTPKVIYQQEYKPVAVYQTPQIDLGRIQTTPKTVYAESYERVTPGVRITEGPTIVQQVTEKQIFTGAEYLPPLQELNGIEVTSQTPTTERQTYGINKNIEIAPPPEEYVLNIPTSSPATTAQRQNVRVRVRPTTTTEASREYLPPLEPKKRGRGKATIVSIGQVDKAELDEKNVQGVLDKYSGKFGELTEGEKEQFVTKVIKGNGRGTIKLGKEPEVSTVGYEITSQRGRARVRPGVRQFSSTSTTTQDYSEVSSTPDEDDGVNTDDISLATLDLKNLKIKKDKKTVIVVSQVSDANPLLIGKLASQCSCESNKIDLRNRGRRPSGKADGDGEASQGDSNPRDGVESYEYPVKSKVSGRRGNGNAPDGENGNRGPSRNREDENRTGGPNNGEEKRGDEDNEREIKGPNRSRGGKSRGQKAEYARRSRPKLSKSIDFNGYNDGNDDLSDPVYNGALFGISDDSSNPNERLVVIGDNLPRNDNKGSIPSYSDNDATDARRGGQLNVEIINDDGIPVGITSTTTLLPEVSPSILIPIAPGRSRTTTESPSLPVKPTGRRIPSRSKAIVPLIPETSPLLTPISADEIASTVDYTGPKARNQAGRGSGAEASKSRAGAAFDRYGPGGWRSADETLQGSVDCKRPGLFRHPKYCNKFYSCNYDPWKKRYTLSVFNCPVHLAYDDAIGACNWPSKGPACADDNLLV